MGFQLTYSSLYLKFQFVDSHQDDRDPHQTMAFEGGVEINTGFSKDEKSLKTRQPEEVSDDDDEDDGNDKATPETVSYDQYQRLANRLESLERKMARLDKHIPHPYKNTEEHNLDKEYGSDGSYALLEAQRMPRPPVIPDHIALGKIGPKLESASPDEEEVPRHQCRMNI